MDLDPGTTMKPSPAAMKKRAALVARQIKAGNQAVIRKYVKPPATKAA